jgi:alginate O-acetyltransferase complex protein AlgI
MMYRNLFLTLVISGLWHGAAWTFVIWGVLHALALIATRNAERSTWYRQRVPKFVKQIMVFGVVWFAWIFFRAENMGDACLIVSRIFTADWLDPAIPLLALTLVASVWLYQFLYESSARRLLDRSAVRIALVVLMIVYLLVVPGSGSSAFIYFQF